jgi:hypothetical protein
MYGGDTMGEVVSQPGIGSLGVDMVAPARNMDFRTAGQVAALCRCCFLRLQEPKIRARLNQKKKASPIREMTLPAVVPAMSPVRLVWRGGNSAGWANAAVGEERDGTVVVGATVIKEADDAVVRLVDEVDDPVTEAWVVLEEVLDVVLVGEMAAMTEEATAWDESRMHAESPRHV